MAALLAYRYNDSQSIDTTGGTRPFGTVSRSPSARSQLNWGAASAPQLLCQRYGRLPAPRFARYTLTHSSGCGVAAVLSVGIERYSCQYDDSTL
jgi:hypothetical protein